MISYIILGEKSEKINCNRSFDLDISYGLNWYKSIFNNPQFSRKTRRIYFHMKDCSDKLFKDSDICIQSSHLDEIAIAKIIQELSERFIILKEYLF